MDVSSLSRHVSRNGTELPRGLYSRKQKLLCFFLYIDELFVYKVDTEKV